MKDALDSLIERVLLLSDIHKLKADSSPSSTVTTELFMDLCGEIGCGDGCGEEEIAFGGGDLELEDYDWGG